MLHKLVLVLGLAIFLSPAARAGVCPAYTNPLTNNTTADATQVMGNFDTILDCVNNLPRSGNTTTFATTSGTLTGGDATKIDPNGNIVDAGHAPGALVLTSTQTASNSASLAWTALPTTYANYKLVCAGINTAGSAFTQLALQVGEGSGPTWETSNYSWSLVDNTAASTTPSGAGATSEGAIVLGNTESGSVINLTLTLYDLTGSGGPKAMTGNAWWAYDGPVQASEGGAYSGDSNPATAVRVLMTSGNIGSGTCSLYGVAQ